MGLNPWKASGEAVDLLLNVKEKYHNERLSEASIAVTFDDSKPFVRNKINLGKVVKFNPLSKLWQNQKQDFCIVIPMDLWQSVLRQNQKEPYLDLMLTRCSVEFMPEIVEENGKKFKNKDEFGRIQFTNVFKTDDDGNPKWKVLPLDIDLYTENVRRYGLWCDWITELKDAINSASKLEG